MKRLLPTTPCVEQMAHPVALAVLASKLRGRGVELPWLD